MKEWPELEAPATYSKMLKDAAPTACSTVLARKTGRRWEDFPVTQEKLSSRL